MKKFLKNAGLFIVAVILIGTFSGLSKTCSKEYFNKITTKVRSLVYPEKEKEAIIAGLKQAEEETNKKVPFMIDEVTRVDSVEAHYPDFYYFLTIITAENWTGAEIEDLKKVYTVSITEKIKNVPKVMFLLKNDIALVYCVYDKNEVAMFQVVITKDDI